MIKHKPPSMHKIKMQAHNSAEWSSCISSKCVCDYMRVRLNTHTHTHPLHMYGVVCLFLQECMPICVCVLPMKDILYMCECYSCPPPPPSLPLSVSAPDVKRSEQGCPRPVQMCPGVACGVTHACILDSPQALEQVVGSDMFPDSRDV